MTDNQEAELFKTLATLVGGVNQIQSDVKEIRVTLVEHTNILAEHTNILAEHTNILTEHTNKLDHLTAKTQSIAEQMIQSEIRHTARLDAVEQTLEGLGGKIN